MDSTVDKTLKNRPLKSGLSVDDVCRILKASEESGILKLKFQDLEFEREPVLRDSPTPVPTHAENAIPVETHKKQTEAEILAEELRLKREEVQELPLTDPLKYEQMLANGELELDEDTDNGDNAE